MAEVVENTAEEDDVELLAHQRSELVGAAFDVLDARAEQLLHRVEAEPALGVDVDADDVLGAATLELERRAPLRGPDVKSRHAGEIVRDRRNLKDPHEIILTGRIDAGHKLKALMPDEACFIEEALRGLRCRGVTRGHVRNLSVSASASGVPMS
jgi:hypothetical protein